MKKACLAILMQLSCTVLNAATLFSGGKTAYDIVVGAEASTSELTAAAELQSYLRQISGADFRCSNVPHEGKHHIYIGFSPKVAEITGLGKPDPEDESFRYQSFGDDIVIMGGSVRGTMYGVFSFLENEFGVRWYTSTFTKVPTMRSWKFSKLNHAEQPFIPYRYTMYYHCADDKQWAAHNKNNFCWTKQRNEYGGWEACLGAHTMKEYLPAEEYFQAHPEYFAMRNGKRDPKAQPCLSNPQVLRIVTRRVLQRIRENPDYLYYDVSQSDNSWYCECEACQEIDAKFGGQHSGIILWFVNQVADAVAKRYPDKRLCTFAYRYSRHAPTGIKPRDNVTIRLCDIECCFAHPLEECEKNKDFIQDLEEWSRLTDQIFIWDYVVNFWQYIAPYPNFAVLDKNIKTFGKYRATVVLEQGQRQSYGGEFGDMKAWVVSQLLWNPYQNTAMLAKEFIHDYYGTAAPYIMQYFDLCQKTVTPHTHIYQKMVKDESLLSDTFIQQARKILDLALEKSADEETRYRVEDVRAQILFMQTKRHPAKSIANGDAEEFRNYLRKHKPYIKEGQKADVYLQNDHYI